jgi:LuxR family transcriptional regulator, maltose regulon positive regulatory protein
MFYGLPGMGPPLARLERVLTRSTGERPNLQRAALMHHRTVRAIGQARVSEAAEWLARADADLRWLGQPRSLLTENHLLHMVVDAVRGDAPACRAAAKAMLDDLEDSGEGNKLCHRESGWSGEGRAYWALGLQDELARVARAMREGRNPYEWAHADAEQGMLEAMVALNDGHPDQAEAKLATQLGPIEDLLNFRATTVYLLCAEAQRRQGKLDAAARTLGRWFDHVRGGGPAGGALLVGAPVLHALAKADWGGRIADDRVALLQRMGDTAVEARSSASKAAAGSAPPATSASGQAPASVSPALVAAIQAGLTEREAEVLALIADGDSNKVIARKLDLSPFTVKRHVANILDKLQLESRTQAAGWWLAKQPR